MKDDEHLKSSRAIKASPVSATQANGSVAELVYRLLPDIIPFRSVIVPDVAAEPSSARIQVIPSPPENESAAQARRLEPPMAVEAEEAARLCGIGRTLWYSLRSAGGIPQPIRLGKRTLWRVAELKKWMAAGCPTLHRWQQMNQGK